MTELSELPKKLREQWEKWGTYGRVRAVFSNQNSRYSDVRGWIEPVNYSYSSYYVKFEPDEIYSLKMRFWKTYNISNFNPEEEKEETTMNTIRLTFSGNMQSDSRFDIESQCMSEAFGITVGKAKFWLKYGRIILCRADQFGMLIALREKYGVACNRIKELSPEIVPDRDIQENVTCNN